MIASGIISLYSNCAAVQSSNQFLSQTIKRLYKMLDLEKVNVTDGDDNETIALTSSTTEWCLVH